MQQDVYRPDAPPIIQPKVSKHRRDLQGLTPEKSLIELHSFLIHQMTPYVKCVALSICRLSNTNRALSNSNFSNTAIAGPGRTGAGFGKKNLLYLNFNQFHTLTVSQNNSTTCRPMLCLLLKHVSCNVAVAIKVKSLKFMLLFINKNCYLMLHVTLTTHVLFLTVISQNGSGKYSHKFRQSHIWTNLLKYFNLPKPKSGTSLNHSIF